MIKTKAGFGPECTQIEAPGHPQAGRGKECDEEEGAQSLSGRDGLGRGEESARQAPALQTKDQTLTSSHYDLV